MNELLKRLDRLEQLTLLGAKNVLTMDEVSLVTGLAKSSLYKLTSTRQIPHYRADGGKHIYFKKDEVEQWMCRNRVGSQLEDEQKAVAQYFKQKGGIQ